MTELTLSRRQGSGFAVPLLIAVIVLAIAAAVIFEFNPHATADVAVTHTAVFASHFDLKGDTMLVNSDVAQDDIYVLTTVRITDQLRLPLFLKDFTATLTPTNPDGSAAAPISTSAIEKPDLPNLYVTFPKLKAMVEEQATEPLYRESQIDPGKSATGIILLHFPVTQQAWEHRKSAQLTIDLYHQQPITLPIP
ncbi:MAG: hypothetical protein KGK08_10485 [Acidobacteriota bacterium]|nr:hypothetical protein [Acidobacteriota bacterium]